MNGPAEGLPREMIRRWRFWANEAPNLPIRMRTAGDAMAAELERMDQAMADIVRLLDDFQKGELSCEDMAEKIGWFLPEAEDVR